MANNISHQNNSVTVHCHIGITSAKNSIQTTQKRAKISAQSMAVTSAIIFQFKVQYYLDTHFPIQITKLES